MSGLTKEQRAAKVAAQETAIRAEVEDKIRKELATQNSTSSSLNTNTVTQNSKKKSIPADYMIPVKSGVQGILVYLSKKTYGYTIEWNSYGEIEYIEYSELLSMRNTSKTFFENNWIFFEDTDDYTAQELYEILKVDKYYRNTVLGENLDDIFLMTADEIISTIAPLSKGVKETIALSARNKIDSGELDSIKRIEALEKALNAELRISF